MKNDSTKTDDDSAPAKRSRPKMTSAGRLLQAVFVDKYVDVDRLASWSRITPSRLVACRNGECSLEPGEQMMLAAAVLEVAPEHGSAARRLHAQAQSALRMREGMVESHFTYTGRRWR